MKPADFIAMISPAAVASMLRTRVPASFTVAQSALESAWGSSGLVEHGRNLFGVKADASWHGDTVTMSTHEIVKGAPTYVMATWRSYPDWQACLDDHARFLTDNPRYKAAFACPDGESFTQAVAAAGYATDPLYAKKIIDIMRTHNLLILDKKPGVVAQLAAAVHPGQELPNSAQVKKIQIIASGAGAVIAPSLPALAKLGDYFHASPTVILAVLGAVALAVCLCNLFVTAATSRRVGILPMRPADDKINTPAPSGSGELARGGLLSNQMQGDSKMNGTELLNKFEEIDTLLTEYLPAIQRGIALVEKFLPAATDAKIDMVMGMVTKIVPALQGAEDLVRGILAPAPTVITETP